MAEGQPEFAPGDPRLVDLSRAIDAYGDRLLRAAFLLCGDATEAQDLVQETFLQAYKSTHRFRGDSAMYTWLYGILRHLCHRHFRDRRRLVFNDELVQQETVPPRLAEKMDEDFRAAQIARALQNLSPEHREVIVLRYYENLKLQEIARRAGISLGTAKSRLHYAAGALEKLLPWELNLFAPDDTQPQGTV